MSDDARVLLVLIGAAAAVVEGGQSGALPDNLMQTNWDSLLFQSHIQMTRSIKPTNDPNARDGTISNYLHVTEPSKSTKPDCISNCRLFVS
jgi:hypothetical protein